LHRQLFEAQRFRMPAIDYRRKHAFRDAAPAAFLQATLTACPRTPTDALSFGPGAAKSTLRYGQAHSEPSAEKYDPQTIRARTRRAPGRDHGKGEADRDHRTDVPGLRR